MVRPQHNCAQVLLCFILSVFFLLRSVSPQTKTIPSTHSSLPPQAWSAGKGMMGCVQSVVNGVFAIVDAFIDLFFRLFSWCGSDLTSLQRPTKIVVKVVAGLAVAEKVKGYLADIQGIVDSWENFGRKWLAVQGFFIFGIVSVGVSASSGGVCWETCSPVFYWCKSSLPTNNGHRNLTLNVTAKANSTGSGTVHVQAGRTGRGLLGLFLLLSCGEFVNTILRVYISRTGCQTQDLGRFTAVQATHNSQNPCILQATSGRSFPTASHFRPKLWPNCPRCPGWSGSFPNCPRFPGCQLTSRESWTVGKTSAGSGLQWILGIVSVGSLFVHRLLGDMCAAFFHYIVYVVVFSLSRPPVETNVVTVAPAVSGSCLYSPISWYYGDTAKIHRSRASPTKI